MVNPSNIFFRQFEFQKEVLKLFDLAQVGDKAAFAALQSAIFKALTPLLQPAYRASGEELDTLKSREYLRHIGHLIKLSLYYDCGEL